jgi:hypothetical protein
MGIKVLTLNTTEPDRDFIAVNGTPFYLRSDEEIPLLQIAKIRRTAKIVAGKVDQLDTATDDEVAGIESFVNEMLGMIVIDLPAELRDKIALVQKYQIVSAFTTASARRRAGSKEGADGSR